MRIMDTQTPQAITASPAATGPRSSVYLYLRVAAFAVCAFILGYAAVIGWRMHLNYVAINAPGFSMEALPYTDSVKVAVTQKLEGAKGLLQASLLAFAVLWGLILA